MAMTVLNNTASMMTLGELNKNISKVGKDLKKLSTGERLPNFGAGASDTAISEKMRSQIRALGQDIKNAQNGKSLLNIASGGVDNIVEELRSLKELALNSCNDHNSDVDRKILQKEFDARKAHIDNVANDTNYNGIALLDGRWKRIIPGGGFETKERLLSQKVDRNVFIDNMPPSTVGPTTTIKTVPPVVKDKKNVSTYTSSTAVQPSHTESAPVVSTATSSVSSTEGPKTKTISSDKVSEEPIVTQDGKIRTVVTNDTITSQKVTSTSQVQTNTTTTTTQKTITDVAVKHITGTTPGKPIIINNGTTSITADGVYEFAPDYTGTLSISAKNVQLQGPKSGATLNNVYIVDNGANDLYIKNLKIKNTQDKSAIKFDSATNNKLHVLGNNSIEIGTNPNRYMGSAIINPGGGVSIVGGGNLSIKSDGSRVSLHGAVIGSDDSGTCGNINIGQKVSIDIKIDSGTLSDTTLWGAAIGSGAAAIGQHSKCGDINIGTNAKVSIDVGKWNERPAAIGTGMRSDTDSTSSSKCGNVTIYSGASVTTVTHDGAGIGTYAVGAGDFPGEIGNITIYSDANLKMSTDNGACVGTGAAWWVSITGTHLGDITCYSYPNSKLQLSTQTSGADKIGYGRGNTDRAKSINLIPDYNHTEGGVLDLSEMTPPSTGEESWEVTTTVTDRTETAKTISETRTTTNEPFEEVANIITTSVYEEYEEEIPDRLGDPLVIHTGTKANQNKLIYIEDMRLDAIGVKDTKIDTLEKAKQSLDVIDSAIDYALDQATTLGAYSQGISFTENNLTSAHEMTSSAESTIRDADIAKEMTSFTKNNILMQASQAMMSQANQNASGVLGLLQ